MKIFPVVMAGGSGTRFWPLSRKDRPKQFLALAGEEPLLAATVTRLPPLAKAKETFVVCGPAHADVLGRLSETIVLQSAFRLTPWVASVPYPYPYVPDPREVDRILHVPLSALLRPGAHRVEQREAYGMNLDVHYFELGDGEVLWGATARITWELLGIWRTA